MPLRLLSLVGVLVVGTGCAGTADSKGDPADSASNDSGTTDSLGTTTPVDTATCEVALEVCDGADNDCNGVVDDVAEPPIWFRDADGDTYGDALVTNAACTAPSGFVADGTDCDDTDPAVHPGATETEADGLDADCDGSDLCGDGPCVGFGTESNPGASCADLQVTVDAPTGAWWVDPDGDGGRDPFEVWCEMKEDGGGWTLVLKNDLSSADHYTAGAVRAERLVDDVLDTVAKLDDVVVRDLQSSRNATGDVRVFASGPTDTLIVEGLTWALYDTGSVSRSITARYGTETTFMTGFVCYDGDTSTSPGCDPAHWCFGEENGPHTCIRRYGTPGIWMNYGIYTANYYAASVWVR